jgi:hypothetical protein
MHKLKFIVTISSLLVLAFVVKGQTDAVLDNKMQPNLVIGIGNEALPTFFNPIPSGDEDVIYSVGVSDPYANDSVALLQAKARAVLLASIFNGCRLSGVFDNYDNSGNTGKLQELYRMKTVAPLIGTFTIVDSLQTRFNERILLVKIDKTGKDTLTRESLIELFKTQRKLDYGTQIDYNIKVEESFNNIVFNYTYTNADGSFEIISKLDNNLSMVPPGIYQYEQNSSDSTKNVVYLQHKGLWCGILQTFTNELALQASTSKSVNRQVDQNSGNNQLGYLSREILKNTFTCRMVKIFIDLDQLQISLTKIQKL